MLGGSSALNVLLYNRGDAHDFDKWETEFGCKGWMSNDVLPYFKCTQDDQTGLASADPKHHRTGGEWSVDHVRYQNPLSKRFLEACKQLGLPVNQDFNNWSSKQEGAGRFTVSERNGSRCSAASALLAPAVDDKKRSIRVLCGAPAQKILFAENGITTTGVHFVAGDVDHVARLAPGGEVLLAGGAIHSPQLLMLSGIGPAAQLQKHDIDVIHDLPGVGENLQDHPASVVSYECPEAKRGVSVTSKLRIGGTSLPHPRPMLQWLLFGSGPLTSTGCDHGGFFRTAAAPTDSPSPDLQMRFLAARAITADGMGTFTNFKKTARHPDGFSLQSIAARPRSRGKVLLASSNANDKPIIQGDYLTHPGDVATMREGLRLARKIAQQPAFAEFLGPEIFPGPDIQTDAELSTYIADTVHTANALVGTCRMGELSDPLAVCDPDMRVKGVNGLRVCDASVMPSLPGGQTASMVVMIAERAAEMILRSASASVNEEETMVRKAARTVSASGAIGRSPTAFGRL
jgi:choline dehydrogenase-like flavoprotein